MRGFTPHTFKKVRGFTLIELLVVITILSILATVVLLVINPAQMFKQSRDATRISDMETISKAILVFQSSGTSALSMGSSNTIYVSVPAVNSNCSDLNLSAPGGSYTYACSTSANYRKTNGTGWIPIDFSSSPFGSLLATLPIDPANATSTGLYYTYINGSFALSATLESTKYLASSAANDKGQSSTRFELGSNLALNANLTVAVAATTPTNIVLEIGSTAPVGGVTNVAIPAAGATDTTGAVTGWVTSTADKIKFTVTDGGAAASTITIGGASYTSGANYTIPSTSNLTIIVTTTEAGKTTGVRTFTVTVAELVWNCGDTLTDTRDSKTYTTVLINAQCWMAKNLDVGTKITGCTNGYIGISCVAGGDTVQNQGSSCSSIQKYCYSDSDANCTSYGGLYQWAQAMCGAASGSGVQGICPEGWHLPTDAEQYTLENYLTDPPNICNSVRADWGCDPAGTKLKSGGSSGFNALIGGYRYNNGQWIPTELHIWSSNYSTNVIYRKFTSANSTVYRGLSSGLDGRSVRCVKN